MSLCRREVLLGLCGAALLAVIARPLAAAGAQHPMIAVTKSASCGCCGAWVDHLRANGFAVTVRDVVDVTSEKRRLGVPEGLESCHTAVVGGYVVEGHVPAKEILRLLLERPAVVGIAVPGMPIGSPGMEGRNPEPYNVSIWRRDGTTEIVGKY